MHNDFDRRFRDRQESFDRQFNLMFKLFWFLFVVAVLVILAIWIGGGYLFIRILSFFGVL